MKLKAHPSYANYLAWFTKHQAKAAPIERNFFRMAGPSYTTASDFVSGTGAFNGGGRWNPPKVMKVVYASADPVTAMHEAVEHYRYFGIPIAEGFPKVTAAISVKLETVLDLTNHAITAHLPDSMNTLKVEDWRAEMNHGNESMSQAMGRAAFEAGLEGLLVPSKPDLTGTNIMIFPQRLTVNSRVEVLEPKLLEKLGKP